MRRYALFLAIMAGSFCWLTTSLPAQEAPPVDAARLQEAEDNYRTLRARIEDLAAANEALQKSLNKLKEDFQKLAEEVARAGDRSKDAATLESLKQLQAAIEEVDRKRLADQKLVVAELESLKKLILEKAASARPPSGLAATPTTHNDTTRRENGSYYSIRDGDTLSEIVSALKRQGFKVSIKDVMDANPGVNWNRLKINQTIFIPGVTVP